MKKTKKLGLPTILLKKVRQEVVIIKTKLLGIEVYRVDGKHFPPAYTIDRKLAKEFARTARLDLARTIAKKGQKEDKKTRL